MSEPGLDLTSSDLVRIPQQLAELHHELAVDDKASVAVPPINDTAMAHLIEGAGFEVLTSSAMGKDPLAAVLEIQRLRTLPDTVGPEMALLVAGLNPSLHAADMGVGFGRPGNRFWPAALAAGLVSVDRDPMSALDDHGVGMTDLVKRATRRADELLTEEYQAGLTRLEWLCELVRPTAVCVVGLSGWRAAVNRKATVGWQDRTLGESPVYLMPSTSGLNAHAQLPDLTEHLRAAVRSP